MEGEVLSYWKMQLEVPLSSLAGDLHKIYAYFQDFIIKIVSPITLFRFGIEYRAARFSLFTLHAILFWATSISKLVTTLAFFNPNFWTWSITYLWKLEECQAGDYY